MYIHTYTHIGPFFQLWTEAFSNGADGHVLTAWEAKEKYGGRNICFKQLAVGIVGPASPLTIHTSVTKCNASPLVHRMCSLTVECVILL